MDILQLLIIAIVQGITEFLPLSSSGHLALIPALTGEEDQGVLIDVAQKPQPTLRRCYGRVSRIGANAVHAFGPSHDDRALVRKREPRRLNSPRAQNAAVANAAAQDAPLGVEAAVRAVHPDVGFRVRV